MDVNDLTVVLTNFGKTGTGWTAGEFTGDGTVDINDLTIVLSNFGKTYGSSLAAVPEPSALPSLASALLGLPACAEPQSPGGRCGASATAAGNGECFTR